MKEYYVKLDGRIFFSGNKEECEAFIKGAMFVDLDYGLKLVLENRDIKTEDIIQ